MRDLRAFARQFIRALMPDVLRLRRLVIANEPSDSPRWGAAWYEHGFERSLAALANQFRRLTEQQLLAADDPEMAANHFVGLLLWIPINRVMFTGATHATSDAELTPYADAAEHVFLRAYGRS